MVAWYKSLSKEETDAFSNKVRKTYQRTLVDQEYNEVWTMLQLIGKPSKTTNNQRSMTDHYLIGKTEYQVHWFRNEEIPTITVSGGDYND